MNKLLLTVYRVVVPKPLRTLIVRKTLRRKILRYYYSLPAGDVTGEQADVISYLESNPLAIFPYPFEKKYKPEDVEVLYDNDTRLQYVMFEGKKLFFKRRWSKKRIRKCFSDLQREQDPGSPHRYLNEEFTVNENDVIADIGAAEGNFSLSVADKVKKLYIFEYNREWIEPLKATFAPWKDKVEIISKRVSDHDDRKNIRFDTFLEGREQISFIKIDVDGAEEKVLNSSRTILGGKNPLRVALCTYHKRNDEADFTTILRNFGFEVIPTPGYMIQYYDKQMKYPYLRRGIIRAVRN